MSTKPRLIEGGVAIDDRGSVSFVNDFDFGGVKRFYMVANHRSEFVRAWHGHRHESKVVLVVSGSALVATVEIDDWDNPSPLLDVQRFVLSAQKPAVLLIPAGYANGLMTLEPDTRTIFFTNSTLAESQEDDYRYSSRLWDPWSVEER